MRRLRSNFAIAVAGVLISGVALADVSAPLRPHTPTRMDRCLAALQQARDDVARTDPGWTANVTRQVDGIELRHAAADGLFLATVRPADHNPTDWSFVRDPSNTVAIRYYEDAIGRVLVQDSTRPATTVRFLNRLTAALDSCAK